MSIRKLYDEREAEFRADPNERDIAWEQVQAEALPPRLCQAMLAQDFTEAGRIITGLWLAHIRERAVESVDAEQERAAAMDAAEHAEDLGPTLTSMLRGLMPARVA